MEQKVILSVADMGHGFLGIGPTQEVVAWSCVNYSLITSDLQPDTLPEALWSGVRLNLINGVYCIVILPKWRLIIMVGKIVPMKLVWQEVLIIRLVS